MPHRKDSTALTCCVSVSPARPAQVCLFDLDYGLPVQVRDQALGLGEEGLPESAVGKEYQLQRMSEEGGFDEAQFNAPPGGSDLLERLARRGPYYKVRPGCKMRVRICMCGPCCAGGRLGGSVGVAEVFEL